MPPSINDVREMLHEVSEMLSRNLSEVLGRFVPDDYMADQLVGFLPAWGDRPLHEFLEYIKTLNPKKDGPDVLNGEMKPLNIFWVLDEFYPAPERAAPP